MSARHLPLLLTLPLALACDVTDAPSCPGGKCDAAGDVRSQLEGLDEPIADWLRASPMTRDGILETDYMAAMTQLADFSGCDLSTLKTFVISDDLVAGEPFPRLISTLCSDDVTRAADLFVAASFADPDDPGDVDARNLEMFAWDRTQRRYVFYAALPVEDSETEVQIEVEPARCEQCHLTGEDLDASGMPMLPIMNELVSPWPHWSSEPDFPSHTFELPPGIHESPTFSELTAGDRLGAAVQLEQMIRSAQTNRVIPERLKLRRERPASVDAAMSLLRPVFCDEQVNYVTEDFTANLLPSSAVVAPDLRAMYRAIRPSDWPFSWVNDEVVRFASSTETSLAMVPVRGNVDLEYVRRLVAVRALSPEDVVRVQALDWSRPVFSDLRCGLWKSARARVRAEPPPIDPEMRTSDLIPILYREIMSLDGEVSLILGEDAGESTEILALADAADLDAARAALTSGDPAGDCGPGFCRTDLAGLGALLQSHVEAAAGSREMLRAGTHHRLCIVRERFPNRPALPLGSCEGRGKSAPMQETQPQSDPNPLLGPRAAINPEPRLIPDGGPGGIESAVEISDEGGAVFVGSASVRVSIDHGWRGDLVLELRAPDGTEVELARFDPADSADGVDVVLPVFELPADLSATGTWTLRAIDRAVGEQGILRGWSLGINREPPSLEAPGARLPPR